MTQGTAKFKIASKISNTPNEYPYSQFILFVQTISLFYDILFAVLFFHIILSLLRISTLNIQNANKSGNFMPGICVCATHWSFSLACRLENFYDGQRRRQPLVECIFRVCVFVRFRIGAFAQTVNTWNTISGFNFSSVYFRTVLVFVFVVFSSFN